MASKHLHPVLLKAAVLFFLLTSFFSFSGFSGRLNSPDETANLFFIKQFVRLGEFRSFEPLNIVAEDIIHPRAVNIVEHALVPGSFLGLLLLYGSFAKVVGAWAVFLFTPALATIALFFFFRFLKTVFPGRVAFWSTLLLMIHPAWVYYTGRSLFPNVPFVALLVIGLALLCEGYVERHAHASSFFLRRVFLSGLCIGLALTVRTSEAGWVLGSLVLLFFLYRRTVSWWAPLLFLSAVFLAFLPVFYENTQLYGNPFYNGYSQIDSEALPASFAWHFQSKFLSTVFSLLLPFGIRPGNILENAFSYLLWIFWWISIPTILGCVLALRTKKRNTYDTTSAMRSYLLLYGLTCLWLIVFYGSWLFQDSLLRGATLGTSYTRYWLPVYVFGIPFAVLALLHAAHRAREGTRFCFLKIRLFRFFIVLFVIFSLLYSITLTPESLLPIARNLRTARTIAAAVFQKTDPASIMITERTDKIFFPERRVLFNDPLDEKKFHRILGQLVTRAPIYYFTALNQRDIDFLNTEKLSLHGIAFGQGERIDGHYLYALHRASEQKKK